MRINFKYHFILTKMSSSDSDTEQAQNTNNTHVIKPSKEKATLDKSNWPLLLKVRAYMLPFQFHLHTHFLYV